MNHIIERVLNSVYFVALHILGQREIYVRVKDQLELER
jgi:hypothetical protein